MRSIIGWFGGKYYLLKHVLPFPKHDIYVEAFGGSAVVLLNKIPCECEIYNDINGRLVNFWQVLKERYYDLKFLCKLKGSVNSRELFERYKEKSEDSLEDAFRFFYVNQHSFSNVNATYKGYSVKKSHSQQRTFFNQLKRIKKIHERIKHVHFEKQDFRKLLKRTDRKGALWYLDPPYFKGGDNYMRGVGGTAWGEGDFEDLFGVLKSVKHAKFVLSIDDRDYFDNDRWHYQEIVRTNMAYTPEKKTRSKSKEYVIRNFDPSKTEKMRTIRQASINKWARSGT